MKKVKQQYLEIPMGIQLFAKQAKNCWQRTYQKETPKT